MSYRQSRIYAVVIRRFFSLYTILFVRLCISEEFDMDLQLPVSSQCMSERRWEIELMRVHVIYDYLLT